MEKWKWKVNHGPVRVSKQASKLVAGFGDPVSGDCLEGWIFLEGPRSGSGGERERGS